MTEKKNWADWNPNNWDVYDENGYNPITGLYKSRYYAKKAALNFEVIIKVQDGYKIMDARDYQIWKNQK